MATRTFNYQYFLTTAPKLPRWRKALARVRSGAGKAIIACVGDSTTAGYLAGARTSAYPQRLADIFTDRGLKANASAVWTENNITGWPTNYESRITLGAGWTNGGQFSIGGPSFFNNTTTNNLSVAFTNQGTDVDVWYLQNTGTGSFTVSDGATLLGTINTAGTAGFVKQSYSGLTLGAHTINLARTAGSCFVMGVNSYDTGSDKIIIHNMGWAGSKTSDWNSTASAWSPRPAVVTFGADLVILSLGINDWSQSVPIATYTSNMQALITAISAVSDILLVAPVPSSSTVTAVATQQTFYDAVASLAATNNLPMLSIPDRWTDYTTSNALGFMADQTHPNNLGYADMAQLISPVLLNA